MRKRGILSAAALGAVLLVFSVFSQSAWSQTVTAAIVGTVTDPAGAAVSGATDHSDFGRARHHVYCRDK